MSCGIELIAGDGIIIEENDDTIVIAVDRDTVPLPPYDPDDENEDTPHADLTYTGEHSESAAAGEWARAADTGDTLQGVTLTLQTGEAYNPAGDQKLYAFVRDLTFDPLGRLASISAERRVTIESPEACE